MQLDKNTNDFFQIVATALDYQCIFSACCYPYLQQFYFSCIGREEKFYYESIDSQTDSSYYDWNKTISFFKENSKANYNPELAVNFILFLLENKVSFTLISDKDKLEITTGHADVIEISASNISVKDTQIIGSDQVESFVYYYENEKSK